MQGSIHAPTRVQQPDPRARASRRDFLRLSAGAAAAALLHPLLGHSRALSAPPSAVRVLIEDLRLGPSALASGSLAGLHATAAGLSLAPGGSTGRYTSPVLIAKNPFTHVGIHWRADHAPHGALSFEVRWSSDDRRWSEWDSVAIEAHAPEADATRSFGALLSSDRASRVQLRVTFVAAAGASPSLSEATLTLLNAKDGPRVPAELSATPAASTLQLNGGVLYPREEWQADESLRFSDGAEIWPRMYVPAKKMVVHHTATTNNYDTIEDAMAEVRAIYTYHAVTLGWGDIGYNAVIDKWGNVYEGRHGRESDNTREVLSAGVVAGHASSHNYGTNGAALLGSFTQRGEGGKPGDPPSEAMWHALVDLLAWECDRHDVDPNGASDFLRFEDAWNRSLASIPGHRDCSPTICPGGHVYELLPRLRSEIAAALARATPSVTMMPPDQDTVALSEVESLVYSWLGDPSTLEFSYLLEGWRPQAQGSEDLDYLSGFDAGRYPDWKPTTSTSATFGELFATFGLGELQPGHYTFHVRGVSEASDVSYQADHTLLVTDGGGNAPPTVQITSPADGANVNSGEGILFEGSASDSEDGNLTANLVWASDSDGEIGDGGSFTAVLSDGTHMITASATDLDGTTASDQVTVTVGDGSTPPIALTATGYKERGLQKADLTWSGATSADVDIVRDGALVATAANSGGYTDHINQRGGGSYTYRVCEAGTSTCSNEASITF